MLYRVNDFGDPHPHPRYQGWFYHISHVDAWEHFRFTFNGKFEKHSFDSNYLFGGSPLGAAHFYANGVSETTGAKCHQGDYTISVIIFFS